MYKPPDSNTNTSQSPHTAVMNPTSKRIRAVFAGQVIADSKSVLIMHETGHVPVYYFPWHDVRMELTEHTNHRTH